MRNNQRGLGHIGMLLIVIVIAAVGFVGWYVYKNNGKSKTTDSTASVSSSAQSAKWQAAGVAVAGNWADADVVSVAGGSYRLYFSVEPEVSGNQLEVYSATSTDGAKWTQETGVRKTFATFPSVLKLPNDQWRMYFQNAGVIKSAISSDGLSWTDESGVRIDTANSLGLTFDNVGALSVERVNDQYLMVYSGAINQKYSSEVPNNETHIFLWATSADGLNWDKKGLAVDSRNSTFQGWVDGAEFVKWDDGSMRLYFWGYKGVYYSTFKDDTFSAGTLTFTTNSDSNRQFTEDPPGDPTLAKINGNWYMYYGQHTKGIYYAVLR